MGKEDFIVFIYTPTDNSLWTITHKQIHEDMAEQGKINASEAAEIIKQGWIKEKGQFQHTRGGIIELRMKLKRRQSR